MGSRVWSGDGKDGVWVRKVLDEGGGCQHRGWMLVVTPIMIHGWRLAAWRTCNTVGGLQNI